MSGTPLDPEARVRSIAEAFQRPLWLPARLTAVALVGLWCLGALVLARWGTDLARGVAGGAMLLALVVALWVRYRAMRRRRDAPRGLSRALERIDPELAGRARRALRLLQSAKADPSRNNPELSSLHLEKTLECVTEQQVFELGLRLRTKRLAAAAVLLGGLFSVLAFKTLEVIEGVDVLLARGGFGPFPMAYVDTLELTAQWPAYLDGTGRTRPIVTRLTAVPQGTDLEVRVVPLVANRQLVLTDGVSEVPLVSDGRGALVAQWLAEEPANLKVAARFGQVLLFDALQTQIDPLEDRPPEVTLEGAPSELSLTEIESLPLEYSVLDDHGLTQVDLVLLSGQRSVREELVRLDGQTRSFRGGHTLSRDHELLRDAFLPVVVRIEARDGNTATGPSWGRSRDIVLLPEPLGAEVAERHVALRRFRKALSNYLADEMNSTRLTHQEAVQQREKAHAALREQVDAMAATFESHQEPPLQSLTFIRGQVEALGRQGDERAAPDSVLLAVDALIHRLGQLEATQLAKNLGESVEELGVQIRQLRYDPQSVRRQGLFDLLAGNQAGADRLYQVGHLGLDLGAVARADLARVETTLRAHETARAEAAALHLAERLQRATPSFSSSGGEPGVESGGGRGGGGGGRPQPGPASDAPSEFQEMMNEMEGVAQDNASELSELERLLQEAERAAQDDFQPGAETKQRLDELRQALSELPAVGRGPGTASSEAATARSQGEAMADALEGGDAAEAVALGRDAQAALDRASELLDSGFGWLDDASIDAAREALDEAVEGAERARKEQEKAGPGLEEGQWQERALRQNDLAERAERLAERSRRADSPLPDASSEALRKAAELMRRASQKLRSRDLPSARDLSSDAQRALEEALAEPGVSDSTGGESEGDGQQMSTHGNVPDEERDRARDFRERVERGLGRGSGRLAPAVRRYAEDLK